MRDTPERHRNAADRTVEDIRRKTRKRYASEDKYGLLLNKHLNSACSKKHDRGWEDIE